MMNLRAHQIIHLQRISCLIKLKNKQMLSRNIKLRGFQKNKYKKNLKGFFQDLIGKSYKKNNLKQFMILLVLKIKKNLFFLIILTQKIN